VVGRLRSAQRDRGRRAVEVPLRHEVERHVQSPVQAPRHLPPRLHDPPLHERDNRRQVAAAPRRGHDMPPSSQKKIRVVVAKPGLDGHDRGAKVIARALRDAGVEVIGVNSDTPESHQQFAKQHRLPFILLSDSNGAIRKRYGVPATLSLLLGRVTYIIDKQGIVRHIFSSQFTPEKHITDALKTLQTLS